MSHFRSALRRARPRYLRCMYDAYGACTPSRCVSTLIHGWLGPRGHPRFATNFWTRSWFAAADGWTRLPRKVTRWPPGNVRPRTPSDAYRRLPTLTDADSRCGAFAPSACDRVNPYPSVTGPLPWISDSLVFLLVPAFVSKSSLAV